MSEKPQERKSPKPSKAKPPSKKLKADIASLDEWKSKDPILEVFNSLIKLNFKDRTIAQIRTAKAAQDLLKSDDLNKFRKKYANIIKLPTKKQGKKQTKKEERNRIETEETAKKVKTIEREVFRPRFTTRNQETEAPSYEAEYKRNYTNFDEAWEAGKNHSLR